MTQVDALHEIADIINVPHEMITPDMLLANATWDSMALLAYLAFLRFHFNLTLPNTTCANFVTVADLLEPLQLEQ